MYYCNTNSSFAFKTVDFFKFYICTVGKSFLLKAIAHTAIESGLNVCILAPTGKLACTDAQKFPSCRCNTAHTNYYVAVGDVQQSSAINWGLADVLALLIDEVVTISDVLMYPFLPKKKQCLR